jgi:hypothetical protein
VQARLHRRIGTMCAIYGCAVSTKAEAIDSNSRTLRVDAFQRRLKLIGRTIFSPAIITLSIEPHPGAVLSKI